MERWMLLSFALLGVASAFAHVTRRTRVSDVVATAPVRLCVDGSAMVAFAKGPRRRRRPALRLSQNVDGGGGGGGDETNMNAALEALGALETLDFEDVEIEVDDELAAELEEIKMDLLDGDDDNGGSAAATTSPTNDATNDDDETAEEEEEEIALPTELTQETMDRVLEEAMQEAKDALPSEVKFSDSILEDEELMTEIEAIFDKANEKLLSNVEEIRAEQRELTDANAAARVEASRDSVELLAEAEGSISKLLEKVNKETLEVEAAVRDLELVKQQMDSSAFTKISNLKQAGIVKQSTLVLSLLFAVRSATELVLIPAGSGDAESHLVAAAVQGAIALGCALIYFL